MSQSLQGRGFERKKELPLLRVENQPYIHYRKGAVVMYLLQDRLGEDRMNAMLRGLLDKYRFKSQPYAGSTDLVAGLYSLARTQQERDLIRDLMQKITIYDLKADNATVKKLPDGRYETTLRVKATKFYADGQGKETEAKLDDVIEIGLFTQKPGDGVFDRKNVLFLERRPVKSGTQTIKVITRAKPVWVGIDPYNKYIDRNSDDNLTEI